nr:MAG TPA: hypothetical protein [Bacteriophage sp.]
MCVPIIYTQETFLMLCVYITTLLHYIFIIHIESISYPNVV